MPPFEVLLACAGFFCVGALFGMKVQRVIYRMFPDSEACKLAEKERR